MKWLIFFLVVTTACGIADPSRKALAFEFAQGVIVDAARSVLYMMNAAGRIDALDLSTGEVIATSDRKAKPLLLYDDTLLVQAELKDQVEALSLVGLTIKDLKLKFASDLSLPSQVRTGYFYLSARIDGDEIIVLWRSIQRRMSAIPTGKPAHVSAGFARFDPVTGRIIATGDGEPSGPGSAKGEVPVTVQKLVDEGALASPLCWVDNLIAALQYVEENGGKRATLRRWIKNTGEGLPTVPLFGDEFTFRNFSRDCRDLLASKVNHGGVWHIYSVISGRQIGEIHNSLPGPEFFVSGGKLIYLSPALGEKIAGRLRIDPPRLVAMDLGSGKELWARAVGETGYVGPLPPSNPTTGPIPH